MKRLSSAHGTRAIPALGFLLGGLAALLLGLFIPARTLRDEMAATPVVDASLLGPTNNAYGFYESEKGPGDLTFRWTGAHATLTFPYAAYLGRHATIALRMSVGGAPGNEPVSVTLRLNDKTTTQVAVTHDYEVYTARIDTQAAPNPYLEPSHVQLDIESPTFRSPSDSRVLGVAVDWIELQPERSRTDVLVEAAVWAVFIALAMLLGVRRLGSRWGIAFGAGALLSLVALHLSYLPRGIPPAVEIGLAGLAWLVAAWLAPPKSPAWGLVPAAIGLWLVVAGRLLGEWQLDDAYISYRYAWNLAHGYGLVYNPGEAVEGYTNFLWTAMSAVPIAWGISPATVTLTLTIAASIALVGLTWRIGAILSRRAYVWVAAACVLLAIDSAVLSYGARGSGMESMLFAALVMLAALLVFQPGEHASSAYIAGGIVLALASLTRPEGLLVAALFIGTRTLQEWRNHRRGRFALLHSLLPYLAVMVPFEMWRTLYYGYPLPNTFYAKTGASLALIQRGWEHFFFFRADHWLLMALSAIGIVLFAATWRKSGVLTALAAYTLLQTLYVLWVGDDHFPGWRFYVPIIAPMVLLSQETARRALLFLPAMGRLRWAAGGLVALTVIVYASDTIWLEESQGVIAEYTRLHAAYVERWGSAGLWLKSNTPPQTLTAAKGAGAIAYYSRRPTIDMFGLTDLHIGHLDIADMGERNAGHDKTDPAYVLARQPTYILAEWAGYFDPIKDALQKEYTPQTVRSPTGVPTDWLVRQAAP